MQDNKHVIFHTNDYSQSVEVGEKRVIFNDNKERSSDKTSFLDAIRMRWRTRGTITMHVNKREVQLFQSRHIIKI
jgi:hypothetical protein